jgi:spore coat-associated protein N
MNAPHIRSAAPGVAMVIVLVLATSASSAYNGKPAGHGRPRLIATPARVSGAQSVAPGDQIQRLVQLRVSGKGRFAAVYLNVRAKRSSLLNTDTQHGLLISIDRCTKKWRQHGHTYTCPGKRYKVLAQRPLVGRAELKRLGLRGRRLARLRLVLTLPASAGNAMQAQLTTVRYSFVGVARR